MPKENSAKVIELPKYGLKKFHIPQQWYQIIQWRKILKQLETDQPVNCPAWRCSEDCLKYFPRKTLSHCPCNNYDKSYLINAVKTIIEYNKKGK